MNTFITLQRRKSFKIFMPLRLFIPITFGALLLWAMSQKKVANPSDGLSRFGLFSNGGIDNPDEAMLFLDSIPSANSDSLSENGSELKDWLLENEVNADNLPILLERYRQVKRRTQRSLFRAGAECPSIEVIELNDVPGFAQTDNLTMCGTPDTIAYLIYIEEPGTISGTQMSMSYKPGMEYADFVDVHYPTNTAISVISNFSAKPRFLLDGITEGVFVGYIGTTSNCAADINALDYDIELKFNFIYQDTTGSFVSCQQFVTPERLYNTLIKEPVLNYRRQPNLTVSSVGVQRCDYFEISQDGIGSHLNQMDIEVTGVDLSQGLVLNSVRLGSSSGPIADYTHDPITNILNITIDGDDFLNTRFSNPQNNRFDTNERLRVFYCYQVDDCPDEITYPIVHTVSWGCNDEYCESIVSSREVRIRPNTRPSPIAVANLAQNPGVCGNPGIIELEVTSDNTDPVNGLFEDITIGFETCEKPSLEVGRIIVGGTPLGSDYFTWVNDDINIDFTTLSFDPDGPGGLSDADGDGFYDDIIGGDTLNIQVELEFSCTAPPDPSSVNCGVIFCEFAQFYVEARRDCGQTFKEYPPIADFNITNGATSITTNEAIITGSQYGINFGSTGTSGVKTRTVEFCYVYERENVVPCAEANATNYLQVAFSGAPGIVHDIEINDPNSIQIDTAGINVVTGATFMWDSLSPSNRILTIDAGVNFTDVEVCIRYNLTVDTAFCTPAIYTVGTHQVYESCDDGAGCTCETM